MVDIRREHALIERRAYRHYANSYGEVIAWYEFDSANTEFDHVYDEGGRRYRKAIMVTALWVTESEPPEQNTHEGRRVTPSIRFAVSADAMRRSGLSGPTDSSRHLNDLVLYRGQFWAVGSYIPRGRLRSNVVIGVNATLTQVDDEMLFDVLPELNELGDAVRPKPYPNRDESTQEFPHHEVPTIGP